MSDYIVPSCTFVVVLLLTFGGAVCEDTETPATHCYYKEKGVTKSCANFTKVDCKNMGSKKHLAIESCSQNYGEIDDLTYCNATFELWDTKGYFAALEDDECWQFETGGRQYPEHYVRVNVDYFRKRKGSEIDVLADVGLRQEERETTRNSEKHGSHRWSDEGQQRNEFANTPLGRRNRVPRRKINRTWLEKERTVGSSRAEVRGRVRVHQNGQDNEHCSYLNNSTYVMQHHTGTNNTLVDVSFSFQTRFEIHQLDLMLVSGECEVKCNGSRNKCDVSRDYRTMANVSATEVFTGLGPGNYCMRVTHGACAVHTNTYRVVSQIYPYTTEASPPDDPHYYSEILVACLSILGLTLIVILVICLKRRSYGILGQLLDTEEGDPPTQWQNILQQWPGSPDVQIELLLLYSRDCKEFCDVMQAFSELLKSFGNVKVLDPMAQNQMEEVSENISGWLAQHLRNPNVRVVIVVSEGAKQRQRALLNNQIVHITYPHFLDHVYTQALQQMHEDPNLGSDYARIFPVRFEDFTPSEESLSLIVPLKCYVLQKHLGKLILELRGLNAPIGPDLEDIRSVCPKEVDQLESTIRIMKSYCAVNPHYIGKHFSLVAPST